MDQKTTRVYLIMRRTPLSWPCTIGGFWLCRMRSPSAIRRIWRTPMSARSNANGASDQTMVLRSASSCLITNSIAVPFFIQGLTIQLSSEPSVSNRHISFNNHPTAVASRLHTHHRTLGYILRDSSRRPSRFLLHAGSAITTLVY